MDKKERFNKIYANIPLNLRDEVIIVIENEPISWKVARLYVEENTKLGELILKKLEELKVI